MAITKNNDISVIIPTLNEAKHLPHLLEDLRAQSLQPHEILVVDGVSDDTTQAIATAAGVTVYASPRGVSRQRNLGAAHASGQLLVFLDADVRLPKPFLEQLTVIMGKRNLKVACPRYEADSDDIIIKSFYNFMYVIFWVSQKIRPSGAGSCIVVSKDVYEKIRGFKDTMTFEDLDFVRRAARAGRFGVVSLPIRVSVRRFKREGKLWLIVKYMIFGTLTFLGPTLLANLLKYRFSHYSSE